MTPLVLIAVGALLVLVVLQVERTRVSGMDNALLYRGPDSTPEVQRLEIHDVEERGTRLLFLACGLAALGWALLVAPWWRAVPGAALVTLGAAVYGNYWFQVWINRSQGWPEVYADEQATWDWPRWGVRVRKVWYGRRRRFQRPVAAVVMAVGLALVFWPS